VEKVLMQHPLVSEVAVIGKPVADTSDVYQEVPVAMVLPRAGAHLVVEDLLQFARIRLEAIEVPREVWLVEAFPRTATGKIRKFELRDQMLIRELPQTEKESPH
jgi:acyl-coenzyme A synthetase/AMP-(fatty) acid ligase